MELKIFSFFLCFFTLLHYYYITTPLLHRWSAVEGPSIVMVGPLLKKMDTLHPITCFYTGTCLQHRWNEIDMQTNCQGQWSTHSAPQSTSLLFYAMLNMIKHLPWCHSNQESDLCAAVAQHTAGILPMKPSLRWTGANRISNTDMSSSM